MTLSYFSHKKNSSRVVCWKGNRVGIYIIIILIQYVSMFSHNIKNIIYDES